MERTNWENGTVTKDAYVVIEGTEYQVIPKQVSGNTPLSAENLNKMEDRLATAIEKLQRKDIITLKLTSDYTIQSTDTSEKVTGFSVYSKVGDKLSFSNNSIVCGKGVKKVLISARARMTPKSGTQTATSTYISTSQNDTLSYGVLTRQIHNFSGVSGSDECSTPLLVEANENATFYMTTYGHAGAKVVSNSPLKGSFSFTYLTVEVVEYDD